MEDLTSLAEFTRKHPQMENSGMKYLFLGGTAVRLHQEKENSANRRQISDFDIMALDGEKYPVHSCTPNNIFSCFSVSQEEALANYDSTVIDGTKYYFMNGDFIVASKTCAMDPLREKDYYDVIELNRLGVVDLKNVGEFYKKVKRFPQDTTVAIETLEKLISMNSKGNLQLFSAFPNLVSLLSSSDDPSQLLSDISNHSSSHHIPYEFAQVLGSICAFVREVPLSQRDAVANGLLDLSAEQSYQLFDERIHKGLIPAYKGMKPGERKRIIQKIVDGDFRCS
ncbi:hypothetical protein CMI41_02960 [Candidatus Pacearchaeota archaeon]|nr:hypothetical protein [Candidatus Pacearchaeota archaeon]